VHISESRANLQQSFTSQLQPIRSFETCGTPLRNTIECSGCWGSRLWRSIAQLASGGATPLYVQLDFRSFVLMCMKKPPAVDPDAIGPRPRSISNPTSIPPDDRDITTQYQRLYLEDVRTWSRHFLSPPLSLPVLDPHEEQQVRNVVLINNLDTILANDSLRRSILEGLVGSHISRMLVQSMFSIH